MQRYNRFFCERQKESYKHKPQQQDVMEVLERTVQEKVNELQQHNQLQTQQNNESFWKALEPVQNQHRQDFEKLLRRLGNTGNGNVEPMEEDFSFEETETGAEAATTNESATTG